MSDGAARVVRRRKVSASAFSRVDGSAGDLADAAAAQIRERIDAGHFQSGQRLPSERDLADELGVSRAVLRESLRSLGSLGYVEASAGRGTFVADPTDEWQSRRLIDDWLRRNQAALRDLIELRAAIEPQALRGGAGDPTVLAADLLPLIEAQAAALSEGRSDDAAEIDLEFHIRLSASSPNQPLRSLAHAIIGRARHAAHAAYRVRTYNQGSLRQHRAIVAALANGDRGRAADLLAEHHLSRSDQVASYLERGEPELDGPADLIPISGMASRRAPG